MCGHKILLLIVALRHWYFTR